MATAAIIGSSASQLLVPNIEDHWPDSGAVGFVGYVPALLLVLTHGLILAGPWRREQLDTRQAGGLFMSLGLALYAVLVAFAFVLYQTSNAAQALEYRIRSLQDR